MKHIVIALIVIALVVAAVLAAGAVSAWNVADNESVSHASGRDRMVPRTEVEQQAKRNFAHPWEDAPTSVRCPRGLHPEKDDTVRCAAVLKGTRKTMLISVTGVRGDKVNCDYGVMEKDKAAGSA